MKLKKGDRVKVLTGKDKGKEGTVLLVLPADNRVIVDGVNMVKKHQKSLRPTMSAGIIDKDMPIPASNVAILCSTCGPTRVRHLLDERGKTRVCARCGGEL